VICLSRAATFVRVPIPLLPLPGEVRPRQATTFLSTDRILPNTKLLLNSIRRGFGLLDLHRTKRGGDCRHGDLGVFVSMVDGEKGAAPDMIYHFCYIS